MPRRAFRRAEHQHETTQQLARDGKANILLRQLARTIKNPNQNRQNQGPCSWGEGDEMCGSPQEPLGDGLAGGCLFPPEWIDRTAGDAALLLQPVGGEWPSIG